MKLKSDDIVLVEGNNELNVSLTPVGVAEFAYVSELRRWAIGWYDAGWSVDIQNIGDIAGDCTLKFYERMAQPDVPGSWSSFATYAYWSYTKIIQPGGVVTFSDECWVGPYTRQFMVKSPAGTLLNPTHPLEFICNICVWLYGTDSVCFATREELDAHMAQEHPEYA